MNHDDDTAATGDDPEAAAHKAFCRDLDKAIEVFCLEHGLMLSDYVIGFAGTDTDTGEMVTRLADYSDGRVIMSIALGQLVHKRWDDAADWIATGAM